MSQIAGMLGNIVAEHFVLERGLKKIAIFSGERDREVRLVEVNEDALPTGQVEPFVFASNASYALPIFIADVTPQEWDAISAGQIPLPKGWPKHPLQVIERGQQA